MQVLALVCAVLSNALSAQIDDVVRTIADHIQVRCLCSIIVIGDLNDTKYMYTVTCSANRVVIICLQRQLNTHMSYTAISETLYQRDVKVRRLSTHNKQLCSFVPYQ